MTQPIMLDSPGLLRSLFKLRSVEVLEAELSTTKNLLTSWAGRQHTPSPFQEYTLLQYCFREQLTALLSEHGAVTPTYDFFEDYSFKDNSFGYGNEVPGQLFLRNYPTTLAQTLSVSFPFGVPACPFTGTANWIEFYAKRGFDVLTYKTVRSVPWPALPLPNLLHVPDSSPLSSDDENEPRVGRLSFLQSDLTSVTLANSFGIPSAAPNEWQQDVEKALTSLKKNKQVLIVSVTATSINGDESFDFIRDDFVRVAAMAKEAGAHIIELNYSCPNVVGHPEGELYLSPEDSSAISKAVRDQVKSTPIYMKIGYLRPELLKRVISANATYIDGVVAINTAARKVNDRNDNPAFTSNTSVRKKAGISGSAIKPMALEMVQNLARLREKHNYKFDIIGLGGVITKHDLQDYLNLGVNAVQSATGAMINPDLAIEARLHTGKVAKNSSYTIIGKVRKEGNMNIENGRGPKKPLPDDTREIKPGYGRRKVVYSEQSAAEIEEQAAASKNSKYAEILKELFSSDSQSSDE